jgi:putative MATE family efflux protein
LDARTRLLLEAPPGRTILRLAWPNVLVMVAQSAIGLIETYFVSRLGSDALAGMALVFPAFMLLQMVSAGAVGGAILSSVSRALGAGDPRRVDQVVWTSVMVTLALSIVTTAVVLPLGPGLYAAMGGSGGSLNAAVTYSSLVFAGAVPLWLFNTFAAIIRGTGNMLMPAAVMVVGTVLLIPLSPLLIFGIGPFPRLGIIGGASAVLVYYVVGAIILGCYIWFGAGVIRPALRPPRLSRKPLEEILRIGLTSALTSVSTNVTVAVAMSLVSKANPAYVAGYGTGVRLEYLLVPLVFGIGAPTAAMTGTSVGAGNAARAARVAWIAAGIAGVVTEAIGFLAASMPERWLNLFSDDPAITAGGVEYLRIVGPAYGLFGMGLALYFASQGAGRMALPLAAALVRVAIVAGLGWLGIAMFGPTGLYAVLVLALVVYAAVNAFGVMRWSRVLARAQTSPALRDAVAAPAE